MYTPFSQDFIEMFAGVKPRTLVRNAQKRKTFLARRKIIIFRAFQFTKIQRIFGTRKATAFLGFRKLACQSEERKTTDFSPWIAPSGEFSLFNI